MNISKILTFVTLLLLSSASCAKTALWVGVQLNGMPCIGGGQGFGPFDYLQANAIKDKLTIVESAHFTADVENLIKGNASGENPEGDIDYTLRAWPNHHRALVSIIKFQININQKISQYTKLKTPPECYLQRAIHFSPQDAMSYSLYGYYLRKIGKLDEAQKQYQKASDLLPDNPKIAYSYSLLLIDMNQLDEAVKYAQIAYQHAGTPEALKKLLIKKGAWPQ